MAVRFPSRYAGMEESGSSESSEEEEEVFGSRDNRINLSHSELDTDTFEINLTNLVTSDPSSSPHHRIQHLAATNNRLGSVPDVLACLSNITRLDLSNNCITTVCDAITTLASLTHLYLRNNRIQNEDLPKDMIGLRNLRTLNLSGNRLDSLPQQILDIASLRNLFLGANQISEVHPGIARLRRLRLLYLGGNRLETLPNEIGELPYMQVLLLSDNKLRRLPVSLSNLSRLQCLHLHQNRLTTLPNDLIHIRSLSELSLRENPLVMRFIRDMEFQPASLLELAARTVKSENIPYTEEDLPRSLWKFLNMSHECVNPTCSGVYFSHKVEHVKFSDFCGKYKIPLLQYLCSPQCREQLPEYADCDLASEDGQAAMRLKRVLLG